MSIRKQPPPVFLIGPRSSGKSTVGRLLANRLEYSFVDMDDYVCAVSGREVRDIVADEGWPAFRLKESAALRECAAPNTVVSTGGGIVLDPENTVFMRQTGIVVYLEVPAELLRARLLADPAPLRRPSLTGLSPSEEIAQILADRVPMYRSAAHFTIDAARSPSVLVREIAAFILQRAGSEHDV